MLFAAALKTPPRLTPTWARWGPWARFNHTQRTLADPKYPHLFWYLQPQVRPTSPDLADDRPLWAALSFLGPSDIAPTADQPGTVATIGWVVADDHTSSDSTSAAGHASGPPSPATLPSLRPANFIGNPQFENWLHETLRKGVHVADPFLSSQARSVVKSGWMHLEDQRNPPPYGRIPRPEDIIGSVQVEQGSIVPESYERMPTHRTVSLKGLFQLSAELQDYIIEQLKRAENSVGSA